MRVVHNNTASIEKEATCTKCGSTIAYLPKDVSRNITYDRIMFYAYDYITCPCCSAQIDLDVGPVVKI
jgi:hypothetical protein